MPRTSSFGALTIVNEGTPEQPSWSLEAELGGFIHDSESLDAVIVHLRTLKEDHGYTWDSIDLEID